eukprot:11178952-Lingulodinium_polyedra.AAC.1
MSALCARTTANVATLRVEHAVATPARARCRQELCPQPAFDARLPLERAQTFLWANHRNPSTVPGRVAQLRQSS